MVAKIFRDLFCFCLIALSVRATEFEESIKVKDIISPKSQETIEEKVKNNELAKFIEDKISPHKDDLFVFDLNGTIVKAGTNNLLDKDLPKAIDKIKEEGAKIIILTTSVDLASTEDSMDIRRILPSKIRNALSANYFDMGEEALKDELKYEYWGSDYEERQNKYRLPKCDLSMLVVAWGIVQVSDRYMPVPKGKVLEYLLKKNEKDPKRIFFFDDRKEMIESVRKMCEKSNRTSVMVLVTGN